MSKKIIDYSNTIIYKIFCKNESITDIYVGHTTNFIKRKSSHKTASNNEKIDLKIYKIIRENGGWENWDMIEIAKYKCKNLTEARVKENEYYNKLKAKLNSFPPYVDKNNYFCLKCDVQCGSPKQYETHLKCVKHINLIENNNLYCIKCDFKCCKNSEWIRHINTKKHLYGNHGNKLEIIKNDTHKCVCGKIYSSLSGLWKHKKICDGLLKTNEDAKLNITNKNKCINNTKEIIDKELIMLLIKENTELKNIMMEQQNTMMEQQNTMMKQQNTMMEQQNIIMMEQQNVMMNLIEKCK